LEKLGRGPLLHPLVRKLHVFNVLVGLEFNVHTQRYVGLPLIAHQKDNVVLILQEERLHAFFHVLELVDLPGIPLIQREALAHLFYLHLMWHPLRAGHRLYRLPSLVLSQPRTDVPSILLQVPLYQSVLPLIP
jgi:hypothetical protein